MIKHTQIRHAIKEAIEPHANGVTVFDGRPFFVDENDFPAIAVYITGFVRLNIRDRNTSNSANVYQLATFYDLFCAVN